MTDVLVVDRDRPDPAAIERAAACLREGGLVAFPTETVYGLGVNALDAHAVARVFAAKGRPSTDPLIVHVASVESAHQVVASLPPEAQALASRFWPGPLTLVLPKSPAVSDAVTAGLSTVGLRVPIHPVALALLRAVGVPVAAPSANLFSRPSPTTAAHVLQDLSGRIDMVLDAGPTDVGIESTVVDLTSQPPCVLRPGATTLAMLRDVLPTVTWRGDLAVAEGAAMPAPGMLEKHYAPRAPLTLFTGATDDAVRRAIADEARGAIARGTRVGVIAADEDRPAFEELIGVRVRYVGSTHRLEVVAAALFAALRELDASGVDMILARSFPDNTGLGVAIGDRLGRAASGRVRRASS